MKVVFDEIDHFHPNFDESVPNREIQHHVDETVPIVELFAKAHDLPLINTASHLCQRFLHCRARCVGLGILTRMTSAKGTTP